MTLSRPGQTGDIEPITVQLDELIPGASLRQTLYLDLTSTL
ncbi:MAG TPA: hypothetical protein VK888_09280 [Anaerolineales bacterium]|nr:hypothetical protein [Anaerolineales bacterium]